MSGSPDPEPSSTDLANAGSLALDTPRHGRRGRGAHLRDKLKGFWRPRPPGHQRHSIVHAVEVCQRRRAPPHPSQFSTSWRWRGATKIAPRPSAAYPEGAAPHPPRSERQLVENCSPQPQYTRRPPSLWRRLEGRPFAGNAGRHHGLPSPAFGRNQMGGESEMAFPPGLEWVCRRLTVRPKRGTPCTSSYNATRKMSSGC